MANRAFLKQTDSAHFFPTRRRKVTLEKVSSPGPLPQFAHAFSSGPRMEGEIVSSLAIAVFGVRRPHPDTTSKKAGTGSLLPAFPKPRRPRNTTPLLILLVDQ